MQTQVSSLDGSRTIGIMFTDKPVTAFEGLALFVAFAGRIGLAAKLAEVLALRLICLLYNLIGEFQRNLEHATLRTLATLGAILGADGRQRMLRLSRAKPWQATFLAYLQRQLPGTARCNAVPVIEANI